jgi:hypothetical protein
MAMPTKNYSFTIDGYGIGDLKKLQDKNIETQQERIDKINFALYDENGDLIPYLEYFLTELDSALTPTTTGYLSSEINVCRTLENVASYILFAPDAKRLVGKTEYNFYKDEAEFRSKTKELSLDYIEGDDGTLDILIESNHNYLCDTSQKIYASDRKKHTALQDYEELINLLSNRIKAMKNSSSPERRVLSNTVGSLRVDQLVLKSMICKPIIFKHIASNGERLDEPDIDGFKYEEVEKMFRQMGKNYLTPFGKLADVLTEIIEHIELSDKEKQVVSIIEAGCVSKKKAIATEIGVDPSFVTQCFSKIKNKIIKEYMRLYEDFVYTYWDYGWYKTCPQCGEVKLLSDNYWAKNTHSNDGFRSICRKCNNFGENN